MILHLLLFMVSAIVVLQKTVLEKRGRNESDKAARRQSLYHPFHISLFMRSNTTHLNHNTITDNSTYVDDDLNTCPNRHTNTDRNEYS